MLRDIPDGVACFIDATIFYYHLVGVPPLSDDCSDFLKRVEVGQISGVTSTVAIAEATHKVMLAEIIQREGIAHQGLIARIKRHPELPDGLTEHKRVSFTARALNLSIELITLDLLARSAELSAQAPLLTNDALVLAVMQKLSVTYLATNDDDFDSVAEISVFKPARS